MNFSERWAVSEGLAVGFAGKSHGVSINGGTPKWMVYKGNPIKIDDLGVPLFMETSTCIEYLWMWERIEVVMQRTSDKFDMEFAQEL